jgi:hypothetical protein
MEDGDIDLHWGVASPGPRYGSTFDGWLLSGVGED